MLLPTQATFTRFRANETVQRNKHKISINVFFIFGQHKVLQYHATASIPFLINVIRH